MFCIWGYYAFDMQESKCVIVFRELAIGKQHGSGIMVHWQALSFICWNPHLCNPISRITGKKKKKSHHLLGQTIFVPTTLCLDLYTQVYVVCWQGFDFFSFMWLISLLGKKVFNVPPESVGAVKNVLAVCDSSQLDSKVCHHCHKIVFSCCLSKAAFCSPPWPSFSCPFCYYYAFFSWLIDIDQTKKAIIHWHWTLAVKDVIIIFLVSDW